MKDEAAAEPAAGPVPDQEGAAARPAVPANRWTSAERVVDPRPDRTVNRSEEHHRYPNEYLG